MPFQRNTSRCLHSLPKNDAQLQHNILACTLKVRKPHTIIIVGIIQSDAVRPKGAVLTAGSRRIRCCPRLRSCRARAGWAGSSPAPCRARSGSSAPTPSAPAGRRRCSQKWQASASDAVETSFSSVCDVYCQPGIRGRLANPILPRSNSMAVPTSGATDSAREASQNSGPICEFWANPVNFRSGLRTSRTACSTPARTPAAGVMMTPVAPP